MTLEDTLRRIIVENAPSIKDRMPWGDPARLLGAIATVESAFGKYNVPKHERAFDFGGRLFNRELWLKWGSIQACSFSSWQIMFPVAVELGFDKNRHPCELSDDSIAIHWVIEYLKKRVFDRGAKTIREVADAYNSGSFKDSIVPFEYIGKVIQAYQNISIVRA